MSALNTSMPVIGANMISAYHENLPVAPQKLQLFSPSATAFMPTMTMSLPDLNDPNLETRVNVLIGKIFNDLVDGRAKQKGISEYPLTIDAYSAFIQKYKPSELIEVYDQLATVIKDPALSGSQRQAEARCVLALVNLERAQRSNDETTQHTFTQKAIAQLKQAAKTDGFTLPHVFAELQHQLQHPGRQTNKMRK